MIPAIQEINFPSYATLHQATASFAEMGERSITTQVRIDGGVVPNFDGWELSFKGERFILNTKDPQAVKDNTTRNSLVDLTFVSWPINELKRYFFFEAASVGSGTAIADKYKAPVNLNVEDFAVLFNQVLNHYFGGKIVFSLYMSGQGQYSTDRALVEINYTYIWDVLVKFFEVYGVRWRIEYNSTTDVYTIKAGWPDASIDDHDFEYGYKGGLLRFERQVQDVDIHNILLGRGGEKNLPYRYFKRVDPQNPDWAADPDAIPELANISFDRLRDINFRWYVRGWMQNPNRDTSWEDDGYVYPTYSSVPAQYQFAYDKGRTDERFNPVEYVRDLPSIEAYGEHWGALDDNDEIFPTIQGVTRDPYGRIDETVAVSEIITDDISAMAQNAAVEKSINRMSVSLYGNTRTEFEILSEEFTIPEGSTGNISYAPFGTDDIYPNLVRFDTENSTLVAVSGDTEYPISAIPAGTYRLKLNMVIARSGQATSATGTYGIENIVLTTSSQDADAWKPTFDIWVKNIWNTAPQQGESDAQYAERVWLPILGDRAGNEAKIVFSSGFMSISEDYEFTIAAYPVRDTSKSINGVPSEWRITLRKSDAEFDATGLYIPNASTGGKPVAGDKFFFIGIDMPHMYVTLAEEDLNTYKAAQLDTEAAVNPTWIMNLDKVRVNTLEDDEYGQTLADRLSAGTKVWITDPRFTPGRKLQLYIQSITYTWNEPTDESPYIVPDIEVVLSDKVVATESVVQRIQNDVSSIKNQYARISDVEAVVRSVAEPIFLKKTGESDSSDSPTQFSSKVTSKGFRQGGIGGKGWGIYRDNTSDFAEGEEGEGDTVIEVDRIVARKELQVNSLVVNQIAYRGGMEVISAAKIEVSKVIETDTEYICYFDQRRNSVANSFVVGDIAMGMIFNAANTAVERYYKAIVTAIDIDCIHLSKTQKVGAGAPAVGDTIIQYGNPTNTARQYVIVRDVIGGGYERMISGLNSLNTDGDEYYFAGKQSSESGPRWFVGSHAENGDYAEYVNGVLTIKADVIFKAGQDIPGLDDLTDDVEALEYLKTALPKSDTIISGGIILSKVIALRDSNEAIKSGINGDPTLSNIAAWYGGPMADKYATPAPQDYAKSIFRFDGSGYLAGGNIRWDDQGYGGIPGITWSNDGTNDIVTIGANVRLASVDGDTVTDLLNAVNSIKDWFGIDDDGNIYVKKNGNTARGFYSYGFISAGGISPGGGASAGNATLVAQTYGGTLSATGIEGINFYSKERVDQLLATAGKVQTVAGVSPTDGDIPVASLKSALGLGAAAAYGIGSVASGNTGLVTGGSVYSAINEAVSSVLKMQGTTTTPLSDGSTTNPVVIDGSSYTAKKGDVVLYDGKEYLWAGSAWEQLGDEASWALKTTSISAGTGLEGGGTLASNRTISISPTYQTYISNGNTAYGWGNHADAGYLLSATAASTYATITALSGVSGRVTILEGRTNWDTYFGVDENGDIYVKKNGATARNFYSWGAVSAGGLSDGGGSEGITWAALAAATSEQINLSHLTTALGGYYTKAQVDALIGSISGFSYEIYPSISAVTNPKSNILYLIGPTGTGADKYEEYVYSSNTWTKIGDTSIDLSGYLLASTAASTYATITSLNTLAARVTTDEGIIDGCFQSLQSQIDSVSARNNFDELSASAFFADVAAFSALHAGAIDLGGSDLATTLSGLNLAISSEAEARAGADTALSNRITHIEGRFDANGKLKFANLPNLYIARTQVKSSAANDTLLGITAISNAASSDGTDKSRIEWDETNKAWHFIGNLYADGFVSAGGLSEGSGGDGITWAALAAATDEPINISHLPYSAGTGISISPSGVISVTALGGVTSVVGQTGAVTAAQIGSALTAAGYKLTDTIVTSLPWTSITGRPTAVSAFTNDAGYITADYAGFDTISEALQSLQSQIDSVSARNNFDEITATVLFGDQISGTCGYFEDMELGGYSLKSIPNAYLANSAITINGVAVSLGGTRTITQAQLLGTSAVGSASVPVWYNGSAITAITPASMFSALSSTAATNLSVTIAGQGRTITDLYARYDKDGGEIAPNMTTIGNALRSLQSQVDSVNSRNGFDELYTTTLFADMFSVSNVYAGAIDATGTIHATTGIWSEGYVSAGGLASSSDERLKSDIKDFGYSAEMLMALRPREWDWNEKSYMKGHAAGVVAQELREVMPYAIVARQYLSVNYDMLHAVEISGLQDHERRIRQLEAENKELRKRLNMN